MNYCPEEIKKLKRWVIRKNKFPKNAKNGGDAKTDDPDTWSTFEEANAAVKKWNCNGIGIVLGDGLCGIDLDDCMLNGEPNGISRDILKTMNSFAEYSPSGKGIHILFHGSLPEGSRKNKYIEMYESGRYFTFTGNNINTQKIENRTAQAAEVHAKYLDHQAYVEIITKIKQEKLKLYEGEHEYGSSSEADLALCNHLTRYTSEPHTLDILFRYSGLYRTKWDEKRGVEETYGSLTLTKALEKKESLSTTQKDYIQSKTTSTVYEIPSSKTTEEIKNKYLKTSTDHYINNFVDNIKNKSKIQAIKTGFSGLDENLDGGLHEGLYIVGAISSLGKTTLILQITDHIAQLGQDVLIFSLEMSRFELMAKSISRITFTSTEDKATAKTIRGVMNGQRYAKYSHAEIKLITESIANYKTFANNIYIHEGDNVGINEINEVVDKHVQYTGSPPVVVIDYLQIISANDMRSSDKQNTDKAVTELKKITRKYQIPIVAISSFNRASYASVVSMESFKESGAIEYSSDVLIGLQAKGAGTKDFDINTAKNLNPRQLELKILKNRNGKTGGIINFDYYPMFNFFEEDRTLFNKPTIERNHVVTW